MELSIWRFLWILSELEFGGNGHEQEQKQEQETEEPHITEKRKRYGWE